MGRVRSGAFEVGEGEAETVEDHCCEVWLPVIAGERAECGGDALQAQMGVE